MKLLSASKKTRQEYLLTLVKKILLNLSYLQGKEINIESGEEPGKCIHEFRPANHEHLTKALAEPWYVYPDNIMRNYDTVDATPLFLIAVYEYIQVSGDKNFAKQIMPAVDRALGWIFEYGDSNNDGFIDYRFHPDRKFGGLRTQSWMDSSESLFHENGELPIYPIAPVEVQAYTYTALRAWSSYFKIRRPVKSTLLARRASNLKKIFNQKFVTAGANTFNLAFAIDGNGQPLITGRSSIGHCLWAALKDKKGNIDCIIQDEYIPQLAKRLLMPDIFEPEAGIRTLSSDSRCFDPNSYHNGSIWPHDTGIVAEGLEKFGFMEEAEQVREALIKAYDHFQTPIELFVFSEGSFREYQSPTGQLACKKQAWSAASLVATLS